MSLQEAFKHKNHRHFPGKQIITNCATSRPWHIEKGRTVGIFFPFLLLCFESLRKNCGSWCLMCWIFFCLECSVVQLEPSICWLNLQTVLIAGQLSELVDQKHLHRLLVVGSQDSVCPHPPIHPQPAAADWSGVCLSFLAQFWSLKSHWLRESRETLQSTFDVWMLEKTYFWLNKSVSRAFLDKRNRKYGADYTDK